MAFKNKYSLVQELAKADEELKGSNSMFGMSMMSYPQVNNGTRMTMLTSHMKQLLTPINPDIPMMATGMENIVGKYSTSSYKKAKAEFRVMKKIVKFEDIIEHPQIYKMFVYDAKTNTYDVFERTPCESLTEVFGFNYNNEFIDSLSEGDYINKGDILYKSTSYDEDMNYGYALNVPTMYTLEPGTSEDAAIVSRRLATRFITIETDDICIPLNDNDFLVNLRGGNKNYVPLPEIGETVNNGCVAAVRSKYNNQLLYDFKKSSLNEIKDGDRLYYLSGESEVYDYTIYSNADELVDNTFNEQLNKYIRSQNHYYQQIYDMCETIIKSGANYTRNVDYAYERSREMLDKKKKWKRADSAFSNMEIVMNTRKYANLSNGQKISARFGNKSVIAEVWDDDKMPYTEDGRQVDLLLNLLSIINRTTGGPLFEPAITGIAYKVRQRMKSMSDYDDKADLLFDFVHRLNEDFCDQMREYYDGLKKKEKKLFIDSAIDEGIYVHVRSTWDTKSLLDRVVDIFNAYDWITYDTVYINRYGWAHKCMSPSFIGEMYIFKLKQSGKKNFSARSMGTVNSEGVPTRSHKNKIHRENNSTSPIRFGEYETYAFNIGVLTEDFALFHALYRSSPKARKYLLESMYMTDEERALSLPSSFTSRTAEVLGVFFKSLGVEIDFVDPDSEIHGIGDSEYASHINRDTNEMFIGTEYEQFILTRYERCKEEVLNEHTIISEDELEARINDKLLSSKYILGPTDPIVETNDLLKLLGKRNKDHLELYSEIEAAEKLEEKIIDQTDM